ncbi:MAG: YdeI/OmpD-associated family protein [Pseudomonadota bacterium]
MLAAPSFFPNPKAFHHWLEVHASTTTELLVGFHKVSTGQPGMSWSESVDEALCFGWIDGVRRRIDDAAYSIRFTPRKPTSIWSAVNIAKFKQLEAEGRMTPAGATAFAKRTEARSAVYSHEQTTVAELSVDELQTFRQNKAAWSFFESTPPGYRKVMLHWLASAKKPGTRAARYTKLLQASADGQRLS